MRNDPFVWFGLVSFGLLPCLKKKTGKIPAEKKNSRGKYLAGKRPSEEKTGGENN